MTTGHIETLKSGSLRVIVYAGRDEVTGKRVYLKEVHTSPLQAQEALRRLLSQVEAESHPDRSATLASLLDAWAEVVDHQLNTRVTSEIYIRRVLVPALGDVPLRKLQHRVDMIDRLYTHLRRCSELCDGRPFVTHARSDVHDCSSAKCKPHVCRPMSPSTIRRIHAILSGALGYAVSWGWIEKNPAVFAHPPKLNRRRARPPDPEQVARLLNLAWEADVELAMFLWLATTTGARRGELAALRWTAVDLRLGFLRIDTSYVVRSGQRQVKTTKTDNERRLSLDQLTVQMLTDFRAQREAALAPARLDLADDAFVFSPDPAGLRPWHPDHFTHAYRVLADVLGIVEPLKNLRHFNATALLAAGVDLRTTAGRLGHGDGGATTLKVYADWMPATDRKAIEQLSTDLAALRLVQADTLDHGSERAVAPALRRTSRPLSEYLEPPVDGRTTYLVVARALRAACESGGLLAGDHLPTVDDLAAWFGIARGQPLSGPSASSGRTVSPFGRGRAGSSQSPGTVRRWADARSGLGPIAGSSERGGRFGFTQSAGGGSETTCAS